MVHIATDRRSEVVLFGDGVRLRGPVPPLPIGNDFTVYGLSHHLRSRVHYLDFNGKRVTVIGYVVRTNYDAAPACALEALIVNESVDRL